MTAITLSTRDLEPAQITQMADTLSKFPLGDKALPILELMAQGKNELEVAKLRDRHVNNITSDLFNVFRATGLLGGSPQLRGIWLGKAYALMKKNGGSKHQPSPDLMRRAHTLMLQVERLPAFQRGILVDFASGKDELSIGAERKLTTADVLGHIGRAFKDLGLSLPPNKHDQELVREAVKMLGPTVGRMPSVGREPTAQAVESPSVQAQPQATQFAQPSEKQLGDFVSRMRNLPFAQQKLIPFLCEGLRHVALGKAIDVRAASAEASASSVRNLLGIRGLEHEERTALIKTIYKRFLEEGGEFEKKSGRTWKRKAVGTSSTPTDALALPDPETEADEGACEKIDLRKNGHHSHAAPAMPAAVPERKPEEKRQTAGTAPAVISGSDGATAIMLARPEEVEGIKSLWLDSSETGSELREIAGEGYVPEYVMLRIGSSMVQVLFVKRAR